MEFAYFSRPITTYKKKSLQKGDSKIKNLKFFLYLQCSLLLLFSLLTNQAIASEQEPEEHIKKIVANTLSSVYRLTADGKWLILPFTKIRIDIEHFRQFVSHQSVQEMLDHLSELSDMSVLILETSSDVSSEVIHPTEEMIFIALNDPKYQHYLSKYFRHDHDGRIRGCLITNLLPDLERQVAFQINPKEINNRTRFMIALKSDTDIETIVHEFVHFLQHLVEVYPHLHPEFEGKIQNMTPQIEAEVHLLMAVLGSLKPHLGMHSGDILRNIYSASHYLSTSDLQEMRVISERLSVFGDTLWHDFGEHIMKNDPYDMALIALEHDPQSPLIREIGNKIFSSEPMEILEGLEILVHFPEDERIVNLSVRFLDGYYGTPLRAKVIEFLGKAATRRAFEILKKYYYEEFELKDLYHTAVESIITKHSDPTGDHQLHSEAQQFLEKIRSVHTKRNQAPSDKDFYKEIQESRHYHEGDIEATFNAFKTTDGQTSYEFLRAVVPELSGKTVVDLASGSGPVSKVCIKDVGPEGQVIAVDFNERELERARQTIAAKNITFLNEDAQKLSIPASSVDVVFCHLGVMLFRPLPPVISEISRILKPGGVFSAIVLPDNLHHTSSPVFNDYLAVAAQYDSPELQLNKWGWGDLGANNVEGFKNLFNEASGFTTDVALDDYALELEDTAENLLIKLRAFFQTSYLLHDETQKREYEAKLLEVLKNHIAENGKTVFQIPFVRVTIKKKYDAMQTEARNMQDAVRRAIQREHVDRIIAEPAITEEKSDNPKAGKVHRWLQEARARISSRFRGRR